MRGHLWLNKVASVLGPLAPYALAPKLLHFLCREHCGRLPHVANLRNSGTMIHYILFMLLQLYLVFLVVLELLESNGLVEYNTIWAC